MPELEVLSCPSHAIFCSGSDSSLLPSKRQTKVCPCGLALHPATKHTVSVFRLACTHTNTLQLRTNVIRVWSSWASGEKGQRLRACTRPGWLAEWEVKTLFFT